MIPLRHNWTLKEIQQLFDLPFNELLFQAHTVHRQNFNINRVQISSLLSIKTGACPEDCGYCSQSSKYETEVKREKLMSLDDILSNALKAKEAGAERFCMGAAWRNPTDKNLDKVIDAVKAVKVMGLETCVTLGMLNPQQARRLKESGLDYYNHNIDTSKEHYKNIVTTHTFADRLNTLEAVRNAGINVCSGGILGLGETVADRVSMLQSLANLPEHPESVPINALVTIKGTPLENIQPISEIDFVRCIAVARILMPESVVRLSAGRTDMSDSTQALCFFAGANSIFYGEELLTTPNPNTTQDIDLFNRLGINSSRDENNNQTKHNFSTYN